MPRSKPHFKIFTTAANHRKFPAYSDNDLFALWARLGVEAIERFADRTGDTFVLHERELPGLAGCDSRPKSLRLLTKLTQSSPVSFERLDGTLRIHIPNLAKKHGFGQKNGAERSPNAYADPDADPNPVKRKRKTPVRTPEEPPLECPELWPPEAIEKLCQWATRKGLGLGPRDIEWAVEKVHRWSVKTKTKRTPRGWHASVQDAITSEDQWGLAGRPWIESNGGPPAGRKHSAMDSLRELESEADAKRHGTRIEKVINP